MVISNSPIGIVVIPALLTALLLSVNAFSSTNAQTDNNSSFSNDDIARANTIAIADERVQSYISGKSYYLMSYGAMTNDDEPGVIRPALLYNIEDRDQLSVTVDLQTSTVNDILYYPNFMPDTGPQDSGDSEPFVSTLTMIVILAGVGISAVVAVIYVRSKLQKQGTRIKQ
ncbi:MAG: hypothetical protein ACRD8W_29950 [Nitrososphaeraceae archaeon]